MPSSGMGVFTRVPSKSKTCNSSYAAVGPQLPRAAASPPDPMPCAISNTRVNALVGEHFRQMCREFLYVIELRRTQPQRRRRRFAVERAVRVKLCAYFRSNVRRAIRLRVKICACASHSSVNGVASSALTRRERKSHGREGPIHSSVPFVTMRRRSSRSRVLRTVGNARDARNNSRYNFRALAPALMHDRRVRRRVSARHS